MPCSSTQADWWRRVMFFLWLAFFFAGLLPEAVFVYLREWGAVPARRALVNSPSVITIALSIYLALFVYRRCVAVGLSPRASHGRAVQAGVLGLAAFLGMPQPVGVPVVVSLVGALMMYREIADPIGRAAVLVAGATKLTIWCYLLSLMLRYHIFGNDGVFANMPTLLPSCKEEHPIPCTHTACEAPGAESDKISPTDSNICSKR